MIESQPTFRANDVARALEGVIAPNDVSIFVDYFSRRIGLFRAFRVAKGSRRGKDAHEYMDRVRGQIVELLVELGKMPSSVRAHTLDASFFNGNCSLDSLLDRVGDDLAHVETLIAGAKASGDIPLQKGRPDSHRRDRLLVEIVQNLMTLGVSEKEALRKL